MSDKKKLLQLAVVLLIAAAGLLVLRAEMLNEVKIGVAAVRERIAINTPSDSYIYNGADIIWYSDDHSTQKVRILGESGGIDATGVITADGGMVFSGNLADENGSFRINDNAIITGSLILQGNLSDNGASVRIADALLVTGTLGVSSQINAANGIAVTNNITATGALTVTNWGGMYGLHMPAASQVVTAAYGITPTNHSVIFLADDGGQASGSIDLSDSVAIVNGTYVGQILIIIWNDSGGAVLEIDDNANVQFEGNKDLNIGYLEGAMFIWHGTDWVWLGGGVTVAAD